MSACAKHGRPRPHNGHMTETPLTFGTAGLRGPMRDGPGGMNVDTVTRATWAVAKVLKDRCLGGSTIVVGRDARHQSDDFAMATAEVLAAEGFSVVLLPDAAPTPVVAFAVRHLRAAAGVQITASHNPPMDNGYKVYFDGGMQIVSPTDHDIESAMAAAPATIDRTPVTPTDTELIHHYIRRAAEVAAFNGRRPRRADPDARRRRRGRRAGTARSGHHRRPRRRRAVRPRSRLPHGRVPQSGGTRCHRPAALARGVHRRRGRHRTRPRCRQMCRGRGRPRMVGECSPATKLVGY